MREDKVLIIEREDLVDESFDKKPHKINHRDLILEHQQKMISHNLVVFVDSDGTSKIIKNRYGDMGEKTEVSWVVAKNEQLTNRAIETENFLNELKRKRRGLRKKIQNLLDKLDKEYGRTR